MKSILLLAFRPIRMAKTNAAAMVGAAIGALATLAILAALRAPGWTEYFFGASAMPEVPEKSRPRVLAEPAWERSITLEGSRCTIAAESPGPDEAALRDRVARYVAALDASLAADARLLPQVPEPRLKLAVFLFAKEEGYHAFADDDGHGTSGRYRDGRVFGYESGGESSTMVRLRHEALHGFMDGIRGGVPVWLNEGTAEYVEEMGSLEEGGRVPPSRAAELASALASGWEGMPLDRFLRLPSKEFYGPACEAGAPAASASAPRATADKSAGRRPAEARHYLQAWSLVHFLRHFDGGRYRPLHDRYLSALVSTHRFDDAYAATFGQADLVAMRAEWLRYVRGLK